MTPLPLIQLDGISKSYLRGKQLVPVLQDLNLELPKGGFVALMGPSGSGKSTLLNLIAGLDRPDAGRILVEKRDITQLSESALTAWRARHVGFVFQFYNLIPVLSALENVELPLRLQPLSSAQRRERAMTALHEVGLDARLWHSPDQLSGGEQQRVAIARAIVTNPTLIVADEPTGDLDQASAEDFLRLMKALNEAKGKTILMVTHDPQAARAAQTVMRLDKGRLSS